MTVVYATKLADSRLYIASDAAVGYSDGYRQLMEEGKWWDYGSFFIGESGCDFALSRIRMAFERASELVPGSPSPEFLARVVHEVAKELAGTTEVSYLEAQLLFAHPENLAVVGGDGGILRRTTEACVGHGGTILQAYLEGRMPAPSKRTQRNVSKIVMEGMAYTARLCESVCDPFFEDVTT